MSGFENPLPGVPWIESPFFDSIFTPENTDAETLRVARDLNVKGYAVIDFPDPDLEGKIDEIKATLTPYMDFDGLKAGRVPSVRVRVFDAWKFNDNAKSLAVNPGILGLLEKLYGRPAFPFQTLNFPVGTQQSIHSDSVHFNSHPERFMCGVWVAMEDIDVDNGPLVYYPGSHSWPVYGNVHVGVDPYETTDVYSEYGRFEKAWQATAQAKGVEKDCFFAKKGQALIWTANLLHGGDKQHDPDRTRWSQVTHYYFEGCSYYTPLKTDPFLGQIYFREPPNVANGGEMRNIVSNRVVSSAFIRATAPDLGGAAPPVEPVVEPAEPPADPPGEGPAADPEFDAARATPEKARPAQPFDPDPPVGGGDGPFALFAALSMAALRGFDGEAYLKANEDVRSAGVKPLGHWVRCGYKEFRRMR